MTYKVSNVDLDIIMADWPLGWHEPFSIKEVLTGLLADAPVDPFLDPPSDHDSNGESTQTPTDSKVDRQFEESRMKKKKD